MSSTLIGPIAEIVTMDKLPAAGPIDDADLTIVTDGGILVENGIIVAIGKWKELKELASECIEIDFPAIALPGFIDAHTHICYAGSRANEYANRLNGATYLEIASQGGGIQYTVEQTRKASQEHLENGILQRAESLLKNGVTTCEVKSGYGLTYSDELKMLAAINAAAKKQPIDFVPTCLAAHMTPKGEDPVEYLEMVKHTLLPKVRDQKSAQRVDIFVEENAFTIKQAKDYLSFAKSLGFSLVIHGDQFTRGASPLAAEVGALSIDHVEQIEDDDMKILKKGNVIPIVLPGASLGLGMKFAPARKLLDHGLPVVIASDWNPGSAPMGDLLTQAAILSAYEKITTAETFAAFTSRASRALELNDRGVLAPGKRGDITIFRTPDYREILYHQGAMKPAMVFIKGEMKYVI